MRQNAPIPPEDLNAWLDDELTPEERAEIDALLADDPGAQQEAAELRGLVSLLGRLPQYEPPRSFALSHEDLHAASPPPGNIVKFLPAVRVLSIAAVVAFLVVSAIAVYEFVGEDTESSENQNISMNGETGDSSGASEDTTGDSTADEGGLIDRGNSAASNAVAPEAPGSGDDEEIAQAESTPTLIDAEPEETPVSVATTDDSDDDNRWLITGAGLGVLAIVLVGLWMALVRTGRSRGGPVQV
jgi:hypothetical protein